MILPTKIDINKAKANERKLDIDAGVSLAKQIDSLRATFAKERQIHDEWLKSSREEIKKELDELNTDLESKRNEVANLEKQRIELIKPLNLEWSNVASEKAKLTEEKNELFLDKERYVQDCHELENKRKEISESIQKAKQNEIKTEKVLLDIDQLKEQTQRVLQEAINSKQTQDNEGEEKLRRLDSRIKEYEVATKTYEIHEQALKEKEKELLEKEIVYKDRIATLERELTRKQNGSK